MASKIILKNGQDQEFSITHPDNAGAISINSNELVNKDFLQPSLTANATLTGIDNKIVMNGIVTSLGLEVGDVIQFTSVANANNQKMRTVESIINDNEIIVNYEHCGSRGNGSLKLTDETLTNATITRIVKWYNSPVGLGQAWVLLPGFRLKDTNYTNTTGRPIMAAVEAVAPSSGVVYVYLSLNGVNISTNAANNVSSASISVFGAIPSESTYKIQTSVSSIYCKELR